MNYRRFPIPLERTNVDAILVLSAPPTLDGQEVIEDNVENEARIREGVELWYREFSRKPKLILSGETQQLYAMLSIAELAGASFNNVILSNCGNRGVGNTSTQFKAIANDASLSGLHSWIVITTDYHISRVYLTARHYLPGKQISVEGVDSGTLGFNFSQTSGEIARIIAYCNKGYIALPE